jgi:hypothetical protein
MGIQSEATKDLSLGNRDAENVAGGAKRKTDRGLRRLLPTRTVASTAPNPGLGLGPDPDYPNVDGGDGEC